MWNICKYLQPMLILLAICTFTTSWSQSKYQVYAEYLYYFANNVEYPHAKDSGDFVIGVIGTKELYNAVQGIAFTKKLGQRKIVVREYSDVKHSDNCHILFIGSTKAEELNLASEFCRRKHVLLVTEYPDATKKGSTINFVKDETGIKFELSELCAKRQHLKINADLHNISVIKN